MSLDVVSPTRHLPMDAGGIAAVGRRHARLPEGHRWVEAAARPQAPHTPDLATTRVTTPTARRSPGAGPFLAWRNAAERHERRRLAAAARPGTNRSGAEDQRRGIDPSLPPRPGGCGHHPCGVYSATLSTGCSVSYTRTRGTLTRASASFS